MLFEILTTQLLLPLQSRLKQAGLTLDVEAVPRQDQGKGRAVQPLPSANIEVRRWLDEVANCRIHGETGERPCDRLDIERKAMLTLPQRLIVEPAKPGVVLPVIWPVTPLQRSAAFYEQMLQEGRL
jgi:hypothetical protein